MNRENAKKYLLEKLEAEIPNREVFKVATKEHLEIINAEIIAKIDEKVDELLKENKSFLFKADEIPNHLWFEMVAFLVLTAEEVEEEDAHAIWGYDNEQFFDFTDEKMQKKLEEIADILGIFNQISVDVTVEDLMVYAKSDKIDI